MVIYKTNIIIAKLPPASRFGALEGNLTEFQPPLTTVKRISEIPFHQCGNHSFNVEGNHRSFYRLFLGPLTQTSRSFEQSTDDQVVPKIIWSVSSMKTLPSNGNLICSAWDYFKVYLKSLSVFWPKIRFFWKKVAFDNFIELADLKILFKKLFLSYSKLLKLKDRKGLISA